MNKIFSALRQCQLNKKTFLIITGIIMLSILAGCQKEPADSDYPEVQPGAGVFILHEGNFDWNNSSLSYYNKNTKKSYHQLFEKINGEVPGDLLQSMVLHDGRLWLMVNNSKKIEAINPMNGQRVGTINGLKSPRYMLPLNQDKAYVTDLMADGVYIINTKTYSVTGKIEIPEWTEAVISHQGKVLVSGMYSGKIYSIDPVTDQIISYVQADAGPNSMVVDNQGMLWVLCEGSWPSYQASLVKIDPISMIRLEGFDLPYTGSPYARLTICNEGKTLYFLGGDLYKVNTTQQQPQPEVFMSGNEMFLYGIGIDPISGEMYISDAIDFQQKSSIMRFTPQGTLLDKFNAGIGASAFLFF